MAENTPTQANDEIDLGILFDKIKSFFKSILIGIVQIIQFFWKHKVRLIIVLVIGVGLQFLFTSVSKKVYKNEFLLKTNFGSVEYAYSKVNYIDSKLKSKDTMFLKSVFGTYYEKVKEVTIEPVIDVYSLVNKSEENKETFELLLDEFGDFSFIQEELNINEYPNHKIKIYVKGLENNELLANNLYVYLSNNPFYIKLKNNALQNIDEQLIENKKIRAQIDSIIDNELNQIDFSSKKDNTISLSASQDFKGLLNQKKSLLYEDLKLQNQITEKDQILKIVDVSYAVKSEEYNISKFLIPSLSIFFYCIFFLFNFLKTKMEKYL